MRDDTPHYKINSAFGADYVSKTIKVLNYRQIGGSLTEATLELVQSMFNKAGLSPLIFYDLPNE